jgi:hypothetical protein
MSGSSEMVLSTALGQNNEKAFPYIELPAVVEFLEEVVNGVEVGSHVCLLSPALPHNVDCLGRSSTFTHGRAYQRRRALHLLNDICRQTRL